jgi:N-acetyl-gamma-glutamyl-phosphate reductase
MVRAKIVGAGGYGGVGIGELLARHPQAKIVALVDVENVGKPMSEGYPHLAGFLDAPILSPDEGKRVDADVVFTATPDGVGMTVVDEVLASGAKLIDYSGDFRFNSAEAYAEYARRIGRDPIHKAPHTLPGAAYGLAELHRREIGPATRVVGNPGCFAVSCILGLAPAAKNRLVTLDSLICDCKTAVSGAGKKPSPTFHYPARYDNMNAYKLAGHQHVCEIERELGLVAGTDVRVTFTAQVVPMCRGIMSTLYGALTRPVTEQDVLALYRDFYKNDLFVRVYGSTSGIGTCHVRGTNYCNLMVSVDARCNRLRIVSHIDNLVKGQAGSACQNMNLMFGLAENAGLDRPGLYP